MGGLADHDKLSPRDREILKDVIYTYIVQGEPVSSRTVAKQEHHTLSSASIRNIMADLEELGYLKQPHTSAGRVPTSAGYHFYIESLMRQRTLPARERRYIEAQLRDAAGDGAERVTIASHLLCELSRQVGVVLIPALGDTALKAVEFVALTGRKVLCVVVSTTGFVDSKVIEVPAGVSREDLVWATNYLNENFSGLTMRTIRDRLLAMMADERAQMDRLLGLVLALARESMGPGSFPEVRLEGASELLAQPELADADRLRRLFEAFNDKARLLKLLNQCVQGTGVRVWIGEDSDLTSELDFSLIATSYGVGDRALGSLGILGPTRMEYEKVIPLVEYLAVSLSEALACAFER